MNSNAEGEILHEVSAESSARLASVPPTLRHVHLIGVAGSAMAALAGMLSLRGYRVTGSDNQLYEPTASLLKQLAIDVRSRYGAANLVPAPDLVIVGNVVPRTNPEAQALLASKIPYLSMSEALWHLFLRDRRVLMVAGTHGKTTSTAMMAHVLVAAGRDPSMLVGGVARDFATNYRLGSGPDFVIEGDEYDTAFFDKGPKFLHYRALGAIITAVEFDHADIYRDLDHVKSSFRAMVAQMDRSRVLAVCADFPAALEVSENARARRLTFGLKAGEFRAVNIAIGADGARFSIERNGQRVAGDLELPIGGRMNIANALGVWVLLREFGLGADDLAHGLRSFGGVKRRQEIVGEARGIVVIDDFAHHPTAIGVTLEAIAERYAGRRLLAAFEPRSNTARRGVFQDGFAQAFDRAARVYLGAVYFKENDPIPADARLNTDTLARTISARGPSAAAFPSTDEMLEAIVADARSDDVIVCMSNGPFDRLPQRLVASLS
ncbi:MAG TPA: Mur ligase family protein [Candidatus Binataceae bacterium]|jgi:UDP-N-acetylmuramate: L-alanyl-gamma-D-glutamyl-meso-diaminopimelate ligase|nr:Mur ligase family protein [Candidatus Binataceae bacterium]